ncbi:MAG: glycosyltransferase [bacterium]|nr:glycosyltransferase [bacterium]
MKLLLTGGGTLGSVTPLLALYDEMRPEKVFWIGTRKGIEKEFIERAGIPFYAITAGKLRRYVDWRNLFSPIETILGFFQALFLLQKLQPTHVFSAGGYVAVPVVFAAAFLGIPSYGIQLDVRPGLANRCIAPFVKKMFVVFSETARFFSASKSVVTGSMIRKSIRTVSLKTEQKKPPPLAGSRPKAGEAHPMLLVLGGGTGALSLNELVWQSLRQLTDFCDVVHITGPGKFRHISLPHYESYSLVKDALPALLRNADCVVTRAGMGTLSELAAMRKAAIVVPLPNTHQEENAALLAFHDAAVVVAQHTLTSNKLVDTVRILLVDSERCRVLGEKLYQCIPTDGVEKISQFLILNS